MKRIRASLWWSIAAFAGCCTQHAFAADRVPPPLTDISAVRIVTTQCGNSDLKSLAIDDQAQVRALVAEIEAIRAQPEGIEAAKIGCSTLVSFDRGTRNVASIHVFPCRALESAPVRGKRFFSYDAGFNRLPALSRLVGRVGVSSACH